VENIGGAARALPFEAGGQLSPQRERTKSNNLLDNI